MTLFYGVARPRRGDHRAQVSDAPSVPVPIDATAIREHTQATLRRPASPRPGHRLFDDDALAADIALGDLWESEGLGATEVESRTAHPAPQQLSE
jgi:hypothetical protein